MDHRENHRKEKRFHTLAENISQLVWMADPDGHIFWYNRRWYEYTGTTLEEVKGWGWTRVHHPDHVDRVVEKIQHSWDTGEPWEDTFPLRSKTGEYRWFYSLALPIRDDSGAIIRWFGTHTDITEKREAAEAMRRSEKKYRSLFESIEEGFSLCEVVRDETGRVIDYRHLEVNPAMKKLTGLKPESTIGRRITEVIPGFEKQIIDIYGQVVDSEQSRHFEYYVSGLKRWFAINAYPRGGDKFAVLYDNITERKQAEQVLLEADRRKNEFLATLAHELRNPLTPIKLALEIIQRGANGEEDQKARAIMARQVNKMAQLIDDLVDISRITRNKIRLQKKRFNLSETLDLALETTSPMMDARKHRFDLHLPEHPVFLDGDPIRIAQILINLLSNAAKYTPSKGKIGLTVTSGENEVLIRVKDNGIGIPENQHESIFELFTQVEGEENRNQGGLGIGLSLARQLTELHGGAIAVHSRGKGRGSEFIVTLPLAKHRKEEFHQPKEILSDQSTPSFRILVVEDNEDVAETLVLALRLEGHEVKSALFGWEGLKLAAGFRPQAAIVDIGLPDISGYEVGRQLRAQFPDIRLIAHTGWDQPEDRRRSEEAGFDHHIVKPVNIQKMIELMKR